MLSIISYIIKIVFSLVLTYILLNYSNLKNKKDYFDLIILNFLGIFILSPIYDVSIDNNNLILFSFTLLIYSGILFFYLKNANNDNYFIYIISWMIALLISVGYVFHAIASIGIYYCIVNYIMIHQKNTRVVKNL